MPTAKRAVLGWVISSIATLVMAATMVRGIFATELGGRVARMIPDRFWLWMSSRFGASGQEEFYDVQLAVFGVASLLVAAVAVAILRRILRRALQGQGE